ncbi:putative biofilm formation methyltransferase WspC [Pararobbsia alpina]|uniref:CheR family methyltransferase n=1 Tax=Pararobbsia alpina TaxID=621374 RepID=UPI0039A56536
MSDDRFERLLRERIGLDASSIGSASIERAVRERAFAWLLAQESAVPQPAASTSAALTASQRDAYWLKLCESEDELQSLVEAVVVPETWFFRDREAFVALARMARERHARWPDRTLRIVSLPCSTGEEPYSIAMALLDAGLPASAFSIDAFDISARALEHAARAVYGRNAFRGHGLEFRDRHFTVDGTLWKLNDAVRRAVRFSRINLFDSAIRAHGPYDFVFCRNVLIYFDKDDQARAVDTLDRLLASDGTLFVGPSETGTLFRHAMQSARIPLAFAFHKSAAPPVDYAAALGALRSPSHRHTPSHPAQQVPPTASPHTPVHTTLHTPLTRVVNAMRNPVTATSSRPKAGKAPQAAPTQSPTPAAGGVDAMPLADALRLANEGRLREATLAADQHLSTYGPSAEVFYLLGLIADADGRAADAMGLYRKTLYLDPAHYEALTHLATLLESQGDVAGAHRLTERAARANTLRVSGHG